MKFSRKARRAAALAFVCIHLSAVAIWLIPGDGTLGASEHLPSWLRATESALAGFKRGVLASAPGRLIRGYMSVTANQQRWWLFAPNPTVTHATVSVYVLREITDKGYPIYEPEPAFTTPRTHRGNSLAYKLRTRGQKVLPELGAYWSARYEAHTGKEPRGIDIIAQEADFVTRAPAQGRSLWSVRY